MGRICRIIRQNADCPKSYRKSVLQYTVNLSKFSTDLRLILGHIVKVGTGNSANPDLQPLDLNLFYNEGPDLLFLSEGRD